jgi:hypothetical protein
MTPLTIDEAQQQLHRKITALFHQFGIDPQHPDAYEQLALALAFAHVPGFRIARTGHDLRKDDRRRRRGRPRTHHNRTEQQNLFALEEKRREIMRRTGRPHGATSAAIRAMSKPGQPFHGIPQATVRQKFLRFRKTYMTTISGNSALKPSELCPQHCFNADEADDLDLAELEMRCQAPDTCPLVAKIDRLRRLLSGYVTRLRQQTAGLEWLNAQQPSNLRRKPSKSKNHG